MNINNFQFIGAEKNKYMKMRAEYKQKQMEKLVFTSTQLTRKHYLKFRQQFSNIKRITHGKVAR